MNKLRDVVTIAWKEIQLIAQDRGSLAVLFLLPLLIGSMMASMNLAAANAARGQKGAILLNVCVVDLDTGAFGPEIVKALQDINILQMETLNTVESAEDRVARGTAAAAIIIARDFSDKINAYTPTELEVIVDPAQPESTSIVTGIMKEVASEVTIWGEVQYGIRSVFDESGLLASASPEEQRAMQAQSLGAIMTRLNELRRSPAISVSSEDLQGLPVSAQFASYFALLFPGLTVMFIFFAVSSVAGGLLLEREVGTLRRLIAAPIAPSAVIFGKMLAYVLLACLQTVVLLGVARVAFSMPLGNSPLGLLLLTLATALVSTSLGMLLAAFCKTSKQADSLGTMVGFLLAGLGGAVAVTSAPLWRTPGVMGIIANLTPHAHALEGFYSLMAEKAGVVQILPQVGILLLMAAVFFTVAVRRFKFE
jgi:ABC-2 type transport system permease protein